MKRVTIVPVAVGLLQWLFVGFSSRGVGAFGVLPQNGRVTGKGPVSQSIPTESRASCSTLETNEAIGVAAIDQRRRFLQLSAAAVLSTTWSSVAHAGLLDDYGTDPKSLKQAPTAKAIEPAPVKQAVAIDPTLRGSYYYPTAKKRYLPRIIKVSSEINSVPDFIAQKDWVAVADFGKVAENAILPLQLYQSSLDGQGLSMNNAYSRAMKEDALLYEKAYQRFSKAVRAQNGELALQAVSDMGVAIADYRQQGRLSDDDGNIPSVDEMRRMAMRRQTGKYDTY